jgi:hypothetical protein
MNSKVWLTTFGVVAFLVVAGTGFYAFSSFSKYSEELSGWDTKVSTIEGLEKRVPYPNEENAKALEKEVEAYRGSVNALSETLKSFQRPPEHDPRQHRVSAAVQDPGRGFPCFCQGERLRNRYRRRLLSGI